MTLAKSIVLATLALATLAFTAISAKADTYHHIDTLAVQMQSQSRELLREFALHYRHKAGYAHLRSDTLQLYRLATHIHSVAHLRGSIQHLQSDLQQADELFHHLECVLDEADRSVGGHVHGSRCHVRDVMRAFADTLHHLQSDVASLAAACQIGRPQFVPQVITPRPTNYPGRNYNSVSRYGWGSSGLSFNGRGWSVNLGF